MASPNHLAGVDMNHPGNLSFFSEILLFKNDLFRSELQYQNRSSSEQRSLQSIAHSMSLEFEYSIRTRTVTISRMVSFEFEAPADHDIPHSPMDSPDFLCNLGMDSTPHGISDSNIDNMDSPDFLLNPGMDSGPDSGDFEFFDFSQGADLVDVGDSAVGCAEKDAQQETTISATELEISSHMFQDREVPRYSQSVQGLDDLPSTGDILSPNFQTWGTENAGDPSVTCMVCENICDSDSTLCDICKLYLPSLSPKACTRCLQLNIECDGNLPCTGCALSPIPCGVYSVPIDQLIRTTYSSSSFTGHACIRCRRHKIKCDRESPCGACARMKVSCELPKPGVSPPSTGPISNIKGFLSSLSRSVPPMKRKRSAGSASPEIVPNGRHNPMDFDSPLPGPDRGRREFINQSFGVGQSESPRTASPSPAYLNALKWQTTNLSNSFNAPWYSRRESGASSAYEESVFDSNSVCSGSQASVASAASGRRGPLSGWACAGMNAVKKVGACWRCKFLRKTCDPQDPCPLCPIGDKSKWASVGCNRGAFKGSSVPLCPAVIFPNAWSLLTASEKEELDNAVAFLDITTQSESWLDPTADLDSEDDTDITWPQKKEVRQSVLRNVTRSYDSLVHQPLSNTLKPLSYCVLEIARELLYCHSAPGIFGREKFFDDLVQLLPAAAVCQAKIETDQLIAQSLICLRSCAKVMRAKEARLLDKRWHSACLAIKCGVACVDETNGHLRRYLDELSIVMFKKTNMLDKRLSWLSIFYSFCIQSIVRKTLIELMKDLPNEAWNGERFQASQYLYLPLRLFIASSGNYDPLNQIINGKSGERPSQNLQDFPREEDFREARLAVGQSDWKRSNIFSSRDYLQGLFEDDGSPLQGHEVGFPEYEEDVNLLQGHKCEIIDPLTGRPCNCIFSDVHDLASHIESIHKPHKQKVVCPLCTGERKFSRKDALKRHIRVVHPERYEDYSQERLSPKTAGSVADTYNEESQDNQSPTSLDAV